MQLVQRLPVEMALGEQNGVVGTCLTDPGSGRRTSSHPVRLACPAACRAPLPRRRGRRSAGVQDVRADRVRLHHDAHHAACNTSMRLRVASSMKTIEEGDGGDPERQRRRHPLAAGQADYLGRAADPAERDDVECSEGPDEGARQGDLGRLMAEHQRGTLGWSWTRHPAPAPRWSATASGPTVISRPASAESTVPAAVRSPSEDVGVAPNFERLVDLVQHDRGGREQQRRATQGRTTARGRG